MSILPQIKNVSRLTRALKRELEICSEPPETGRVLIFSPHFDDETIGCGGTIFKHSGRGDEVTVLYLTDGTRGTPDMHRDIKFNALRKKEAENACKILGVKNRVFWDLEERRLSCNESTVKMTERLLQDLQPNAILLPSMFDPHPDHVETCKILANALQEIDFETSINMFEIWNPVPVNRLVDISDVFDRKREALLQYESQLKNLNYLKGIEGLNSYRATITSKRGGKRYAEGFIHCDTKTYLELLNHVLQ